MQDITNNSPRNHPATKQRQKFYYLTLVTLFIFGFFYNRYVARLEIEGREQGKTSLLVVFGVLVTLIPVRIFSGRRSFWCTVWLFSASGFWMVIGSIYRYLMELNDCEEAKRQLRQSMDKLTNAKNA